MAANYQHVAIADLQPGMVIVQITEQNGPVKIRKSGLVSSQEMVQGLREMGVLEVQIDPAQTVELEPTANTSSMQRILMNNQRGQTLDNSLSEQFNRSLFLPSVSGIPSSWQYHARQAATLLLVIAGGFGIGWTAATFEQWRGAFIPAITEQVPVVVAPTPAANLTAIAPEVSDSDNSQPAVTLMDNSPVELNSQSVNDVSAMASENTNSSDDPVKESNDRDSEQDQISPELLKKFNQAVAQLGDRQDVQPSEPPPVIATTVVRIDQLPAWVLAELPPMEFSAHMYASEISERWVTMNEVRLHEGDWYDDNLRVEEILPQQVILNYRGQQFSMNALSQW